MRTVNAAKHEQKRMEILAAAGRCFAKDGFRAATISDICKAARISPGHLYHYFSNKEAIIEAMAAEALRRAHERFGADKGDFIAAITSGVRRPRPEQKLAAALFLDTLAEAARNASMAEILTGHSIEMRDLLARQLQAAEAAGRIRPTVDAAMAAALIICLNDLQKVFAVRFPSAAEDAFAELLGQFVQSVLRPEAAAPEAS